LVDNTLFDAIVEDTDFLVSTLSDYKRLRDQDTSIKSDIERLSKDFKGLTLAVAFLLIVLMFGLTVTGHFKPNLIGLFWGLVAFIYLITRPKDPIFTLYSAVFFEKLQSHREKLIRKRDVIQQSIKDLTQDRQDAFLFINETLHTAVQRHRSAYLDHAEPIRPDILVRLREAEELIHFARSTFYKIRSHSSDLEPSWIEREYKHIRNIRSLSRSKTTDSVSGSDDRNGASSSTTTIKEGQILLGDNPKRRDRRISPKNLKSQEEEIGDESAFVGESDGPSVVAEDFRNENSPLKESSLPRTEFRPSGQKINWQELSARAAEVGLRGELLVVEIEKNYLSLQGRVDLADKIKHVSVDSGDGAGYDILSFFPDGRYKFIEVKSTMKDASERFFLSRRELEFLRDNPNSAFLYRVVLQAEGYHLSVFSGASLDATCNLVPTHYHAKKRDT
jgi:hypothetical protein